MVEEARCGGVADGIECADESGDRGKTHVGSWSICTCVGRQEFDIEFATGCISNVR